MKKITNWILIFILLTSFFSNVVTTEAKTVTPADYGFSIDTTQYDLIWYPSDTFEVYASIHNARKADLIAYIDIICCVATLKTDKTTQLMLVYTKTRPIKGFKSQDGYYSNTLIDNIEVGMYYSDIQNEINYSPDTSTVSGQSTSSVEGGLNFNFGKGAEAAVSFGHSCTVDVGGIRIEANSYGKKIYLTKIKYKYDPQIGISPFSNKVNVSLTNNFKQTFVFKYDNGEAKLSMNHISVNAGFRVAQVGTRAGITWNGAPWSLYNEKFNFANSFYLGGE